MFIPFIIFILLTELIFNGEVKLSPPKPPIIVLIKLLFIKLLDK